MSTTYSTDRTIDGVALGTAEFDSGTAAIIALPLTPLEIDKLDVGRVQILFDEDWQHEQAQRLYTDAVSKEG